MRHNGAAMQLHSTEPMSGRARAYLWVAAARHLLVGLVCVTASGLFISPAYTQIKGVASIPMWGVMFLGAGLACGLAAVIGSRHLARVGLILSAISTAVWGGGFIAAIASDLANDRPVSGPTGAVVFIAIAIKDLIICRNPMRTPFEDLVRRIVLPEEQR